MSLDKYVWEIDPYLDPYKSALKERFSLFAKTEKRLTRGEMSLAQFASSHKYFGLHFEDNKWYFREWAPNAIKIYMIGDMTNWKEERQGLL